MTLRKARRKSQKRRQWKKETMVYAFKEVAAGWAIRHTARLFTVKH